MYADLEQIQPGWEVYEPTGNQIGDVVAVESNTVHVHTHGLSTPDLYIPQNAIAEIEERRVEINVPKDDLNGRGWERPPEA
jgi:hypothetical protein